VARDEGVTVIFSSHQLSEVEDVCNRVAVLHGGRLRAEAEVADLLQSEDCWVELQSDRNGEAREWLGRLPWCSDPALTERGSLRVRVLRERCAELNAALVRGGFAVSHFAPERMRLEDYFHRTIREPSDA